MPASTVILSAKPVEHVPHKHCPKPRQGDAKCRARMVPVYRGMDRATLKAIQSAAKYAAKRKARAPKGGVLSKLRKAFAA